MPPGASAFRTNGCVRLRPLTVRSSTQVITALGLSLALGPGCRSYPGAGPFASVPGFARVEPTRPSGTETRASFRLKNGMYVVLEENHATSAVALQAWVDAGTLLDPPERPGVSYLLKETLSRSPRVAELGALGGRVSAWVGHDQSVFHAIFAAAHAGAAVGILSEILSRPVADSTQLESARRAASATARQIAVAPERIATNLAFATAFGAGAYGQPVVATGPQLEAITVADLQTFQQRFYNPARTTLVIVGDFNPEFLRGQLAATFGAWSGGDKGEKGDASVPTLAQLPTAPSRIAVTGADVSQPELVVAFRTPAANHRDIPALETLAALAGRGGSGRLHSEIVRNRQMATSTGTFLFNARHAGVLVAHATLAPGHIDEAARVLIDELLRFGREPAGSDEVERARTAVEGEDAADKAAIDGYATKLAWFASTVGEPNAEKRYREHFRKVDASDVLAVGRKYLRPENMVLAVVVPSADDARRSDRVAKVSARLKAVVDACDQPTSAPLATASKSASTAGQDFVDYALPSGVRVLVIPDDTASQVSVRAVWSGGGRFEDGPLAGASALIASLLPLGTRTKGAQPIQMALTEIAGTLEGFSSADALGLRGEFLASRWERGLELMVDVLRNPLFAEEDVEGERRVQLNQIRLRDEAPSAFAQRLFREALYGPRHPYRHETLGTAESVSSLTRRRLLDHFRRYYPPHALTIAVVGAVSPARTAAKLQALFADVRPAPREPGQVAVMPDRTAPIEIVRVGAKTTGHVMLGYPGLSLRDPDRYALDVLADALSASRTADVTVAANESVEGGYFAMSMPVPPEAIDDTVANVRREIARVVEGGLAPGEIAKARDRLVGRRALAFERRAAVALSLSMHGAFSERGAAYRRDADELAKVKVEDVLRVAKRVLDPRREILVVVRPPNGDGPMSGMNRAPVRYTLR